MLSNLYTPYAVLLLVPSVALAAFVVLALLPLHLARRLVYVIALLGGVAAMAIMLPLLVHCVRGTCSGTAPIFNLVVGTSTVSLALVLNPLSAVFAMTVSVIGSCVMFFSINYMADSALADLRRYFALMNLFMAAMLTMVLAGDSIVFFLGWEMMGLCSYFLIAINTVSPQAIRAGRKAFIMTRLADAFLLAALLLLFLEAGSVRLDALIHAGLTMDESHRAIIAWLLFGGALGKSAQVPFHTWLPSAMAGPTPVSALLHSATMVAAGAFLLMRFAPLMELVPSVQTVAAVLGVLTAAFGALSAVFQQDVKRLLAYSSISQIGFMMLSIGVGAPAAAAAHFVVHAIFKSLLFLAAGDITHGSAHGTDLSAMRGGRQRRPLAFAAFTAGAASLAGLPLITAGWWSKEAVLASVYGSGSLGHVLWAVALMSAVVTGTYAFRPVLTGLEQEPVRSATRAASPHTHGVSALGSIFAGFPLALLGIASLAGGVLVDPIIRFLGGEAPHAPAATMLMAAMAPLIGASLAVALVTVPELANGLSVVRQIGHRSNGGVTLHGKQVGPFVRIALWLSRGARVDHVYQVLFVWPFVHLVRWLNGYRGGVADPVGNLPVLAAVRLKEVVVGPLAHDEVDRMWMRLAGGIVTLWSAARRIQTGRTRDYGLAMAGGIAALLLLAWGLT